MGAEGAGVVASLLDANKTILSLDVGGEDFGHDVSARLAISLALNRSLTFVRIAGALRRESPGLQMRILIALRVDASLGHPGAIQFAKALQQNKSITSFDFSGSCAGVAGGRVLARACLDGPYERTRCVCKRR